MAFVYKVTPFVAAVGHTEGSKEAAAQLDALIASWTAMGWEYVRLERVDTFIEGTGGCFGIGAESGHMASLSMVVFRHEAPTPPGN